MIAFEIETMAKKKSAAGRPKATETREQILTIRGKGPYKEWLQRIARASRIDMVQVIDIALAEYAKTRGLEAPPER